MEIEGEKEVLSYTREKHPQYGDVYVIRIHPNLWDNFKARVSNVQWEEVTPDIPDGKYQHS
jgi:hypothetical protein